MLVLSQRLFLHFHMLNCTIFVSPLLHTGYCDNLGEGINRVDNLLKSRGEQITFPSVSCILKFAQIPDGRAPDEVIMPVFWNRASSG
jgi:hypothetical protein